MKIWNLPVYICNHILALKKIVSNINESENKGMTLNNKEEIVNTKIIKQTRIIN